MPETPELAVTHPSGWWKASDGQWYPPDQQPGDGNEGSRGLVPALSIGVGATVLGALLPYATTVRNVWGDGNLTLLVAGTAGALLTRWWVFERPRPPRPERQA